MLLIETLLKLLLCFILDVAEARRWAWWILACTPRAATVVAPEAQPVLPAVLVLSIIHLEDDVMTLAIRPVRVLDTGLGGLNL